jgi:hypothetical protein
MQTVGSNYMVDLHSRACFDFEYFMERQQLVICLIMNRIKNRYMNQIIGCFILSFSTSWCLGQDKNHESKNFFDSNNFYADTLYIKSRFMECGEWGGHLEISKVYLTETDFYLNYQKFDVDCNSVNENNLTPNQKLAKNVFKKLLTKDKKLIRLYMHQILDAKFREPITMQAGNIFEVVKSDNSINIRVYTLDVTTKNEYLEFIKNLLE